MLCIPSYETDCSRPNFEENINTDLYPVLDLVKSLGSNGRSSLPFMMKVISLILGECHMTTLNSNPLYFDLVETNTTVTFLECSCGGSFDAALVKEIPF